MAAPAPSRLNATLFDKLVADSELSGLRGAEVEKLEASREAMRYYAVPRMDRFNEGALRATVRRELGWLLNTTNLGAIVDLEAYPHVKTSVLNYGIPDMTGKSLHQRFVNQRARDIRTAIRAFEPRIAEKSLTVEAVEQVERENSLTFVIQGDIVSAVAALPIKLRTDVEADTGSVTVRE